MSFTPGPWGREDEVNPEMITAGRDADGCYIYTADVWEIGLEEPEIEANARLIAAAPEMLEALEELVDDIWPVELDDDIGPPEEGGTISGPVRAELIAQARDLIARIKETPNA